MPPLLSDVLFIVTALSGLALCGVGVYCWRGWTEPGVVSFAAFAVIIGIAGIAGGGVGLLRQETIPTSGTTLWGDIGIFMWALSMIPWGLFAFQYTGRLTELKSRTKVLMFVPLLPMIPPFLRIGAELARGRALFQFLLTIVILYFFCLMIIGIYLVLRTSYRYGHLPVSLGISLAIAGSSTLIFVNSTGALLGEASGSIIVAVYSLGYLLPALALGLAVFNFDMFESAPAIGAIGERAIARETNDLIFVVDISERLIKINETVVNQLDCDRDAVLGTGLAGLLGHSIDDLESTDTVTLDVETGQRIFDPQLSQLTDQHDRPLGYILSLRDVTDRELRQQRLTVLDRVLRHNLRNQVEVIKANAEVLADETEEAYAPTILDSATKLAELGQQARSIDESLSRPLQLERFDLVSVLTDVSDSLTGEHDQVPISLDTPDSAKLSSDREIVHSTVRSALKAATEYADSECAVTLRKQAGGHQIDIHIDGDGIPETELAPLAAGIETAMEHGTGLTLWQLNWGVLKLNGSLEFQSAEGTSIKVTLPDIGERTGDSTTS